MTKKLRLGLMVLFQFVFALQGQGAEEDDWQGYGFGQGRYVAKQKSHENDKGGADKSIKVSSLFKYGGAALVLGAPLCQRRFPNAVKGLGILSAAGGYSVMVSGAFIRLADYWLPDKKKKM